MLLRFMFLFRLLCLIANCDPVHNPPEILDTPKDPKDVERNRQLLKTRPLVRTSSGFVEGYRGKSEKGRVFFAFEGIPYGESTAGSRRWKSPVPKRPWKGILQTKKPGRVCIQIDTFKLSQVVGSEDCLFLNVYGSNFLNQNRSSSFNLFPVVVFIHGGSFQSGSGSGYGPAYFMNEDVILVTLNYRLGPLGFLSTGNRDIPGNFGLKDQALALKWVNENILRFGGNPENITLLGNSAGGASVHLHMISNSSRNYFSTAYSSSASGFHYWSVQNTELMLNYMNRLADTFGCRKKTSEETGNCLRNIDAGFLAVAQYNQFDWLPISRPLFGPTVEPNHPEAFLTTWPETAYKNGLNAKKPYILGLTKDEGKPISFTLDILRTFLPNWFLWGLGAQHYLEFVNFAKDPVAVTGKIKNFYMPGVSLKKASLDVLTKMESDRLLNFGVIKGLQAHVTSGAPTYFYRFTFTEGTHNYGNYYGFSSREWGVSHGEDMFYFFNVSLLVDGHRLSDPDHQLSDTMIKLLVNFAKTGTPSYPTKDGNNVRIWEPVKNASIIRGLTFDKRIEMRDLPNDLIRRLNFWAGLGLPNGTLWAPLYENLDDNILKFN